MEIKLPKSLLEADEIYFFPLFFFSLVPMVVTQEVAICYGMEI